MIVVLVTLAVATATSSPSFIDRGVPPEPREDWPCPTASDIAPCVCHADAYRNLRMNCSDAKDHDTLLAVFNQPFPFYDFLELTIDHTGKDDSYNLETLTPGIFGTCTFTRVIIKGTKIKIITESVFAPSHDILEYFNLAENEINTFPFESVGLYTKLDTLVLDDNQLIQVLDLASPSLEVFSINGNAGLYFPQDIFHQSPSLTKINMARIELGTLEPSVFENLEYLQDINLEENNLVELNEFAINPIGGKLKMLRLNQNQISNVIQGAISGKLKRLNEIGCTKEPRTLLYERTIITNLTDNQ